MKKLITLSMILMMACSMANAEREEGKVYARLAVVVGTERLAYDYYKVTCQDKDSNLWIFFEDDNRWKVCDFCNLLMYAYDDDFTHDEVVDVTYEGYLTPSACAVWLTH